jgi:VanZ family protein
MEDVRPAGPGPLSGRRRIALWIPSSVWAGLILLLSAQPASRLPPSGIAGADKLVHAAIYAILGALMARAALGAGVRRGAALILAAGSAAAFGLFDEWTQQFAAGRFPDVADAAADTIGAALGAGLVLLRRR